MGHRGDKMSMFVIENIFLNIILIMFPILIYFLLSCYKDEISKQFDDLILNISLATSLYLCLKFGTITDDNKILLFCNIPIVIAYMKKKPVTAIVLSIVNVLYCYFSYDIVCYSTILKYISYLIIYFLAIKKRISMGSFILCIAVLQGFFLSFEYFFQEDVDVFKDFVELLFIVFLYYLVAFSIVYLFKLIEKIKTLNSSIKDLEKDKKIKDALFKLTHEIKNPLAVCKGYLDMIDLEKKDKAIKYIDIMKQEISRSLNIMTDFTEFNKIKIVKEQIDLNLLLDDLYESFKLILKAKNIKLTYIDREDEDIYFDGDYERIKQVLINLIKNSIESIDEKGEIKIYSDIYEKYIDIVVEDNGQGMDEETLKHLTEMFYTTKIGGSGLGVALSNEIIKAHRGELIYKSKINEGTIVKIRLPIN